MAPEDIVKVIGMLAIFVAFGFFAAGQNKKRWQVWRAFAETRGAEFLPTTGVFGGVVSARVRLSLGGVEVELSVFEPMPGGSSHRSLHTRARAASDALPKFEVRRRGLVSAVSEVLGTEEVALGDADFDGAYAMYTSAPNATIDAWTDEARARMLEFADDPRNRIRVRSDGKHVDVDVPCHVSDARTLDALATIAAELAADLEPE